MKKSLTAMVIATEAVIAVGLAATAHASLGDIHSKKAP
jgi:hypothetical protein